MNSTNDTLKPEERMAQFKKMEWKRIRRAFRIAHHQVNIMSPTGIACRVQAAHEMRQFTGRWDLCTLDHSFTHLGMGKHKIIWASNSLRRFLR